MWESKEDTTWLSCRMLFISDDGYVYIGPYGAKGRTGHGKIFFPNGSTMIGEYQDDQANGPGLLTG